MKLEADMRFGVKISLALTTAVVITISLCAWLVPAAQAVATNAYKIQDNATGGQCTAIGTWNNASKTCTLNKDVAITAEDVGIDVDGDGITLDGAGHTLTLNGTYVFQYGVQVDLNSNVTVKNVSVNRFNRGIHFSSCTNCTAKGNRVENNYYGISVVGGSGNSLSDNTLTSNAFQGVSLVVSNSNMVYNNDFIANTTQINSNAGSQNVYDNYFNTYDSRAEGCINNSPFNYRCDADYSFTGGTSSAVVLRGGWRRAYWTWYDDVGGDNWVLFGNIPLNTENILYDLMIDGVRKPLASVPGNAPGYVPPGSTIANKYPGLVGGPVNATLKGGDAFVMSQRILWPKGGNSLEEVNYTGMSSGGLDSRLYWTWYDMVSPGYKNWVLISNPNDYEINYNIKIAGTVMAAGKIPANGRVTPTFPGVIGGPVEANGWNSNGDPVYIMGSQRVLSNGDTAFNEQPGMSASYLSDNYTWTWYDMASPGASNWVLVANPTNAAGPIYYEVWIAGTKVKDGGPIQPGGNETPVFPGTIGGPVQVKSFSDAGHSTPVDAIASQRIIWGPSFGEVLGNAYAQYVHVWTWYDMASPGARNWVLVANPSIATGPIYYELWVGQNKIKDGGPISPGGNETPTFPGTIDGPVLVITYSDAAHTSLAASFASQRVLWNGYFNEVWSQNLS
jgi:parallel beta-helix repeat protein